MEGRRGKEESVVWRCHCRELIKAKAISENSICVCNKESNNPENKELKAWSDLYRCRSISHAILFDSPIRIIDRIWRVSLQAGSFSYEESGLSLQDTGLMKIDGVVVASMERER